MKEEKVAEQEQVDKGIQWLTRTFLLLDSIQYETQVTLVNVSILLFVRKAFHNRFMNQRMQFEIRASTTVHVYFEDKRTKAKSILG